MATKLCTPVIDGHVSNLSTMVFVANCVPGATVIIRSLTRPNETLVETQIGQTAGFLPLQPNMALIGGDQLVAVQQDPAGNVSPETQPQLAVVVRTVPTNPQEKIPSVDISGRIWGCGRYAYVGGAEAGATVEVLRSGLPIESAIAHGGVARITLSQAWLIGTAIQVRQRVGALVSDALNRDVETLPVEPELQLPRPILQLPIRNCRTQIRIDGVFEGSDVTLTRGSGEVETAGFDLSGLWFNLATPLDLSNGSVTVKQELPWCRNGGDEATAAIEPAEAPKNPYVHPPCLGAASIFIDGLERGAEVRITVGADTYVTIASGEGSNRFDVDPLPPGNITVQIALCGMSSDLITVAVQPQPEQIDTPVIVPRLLACQHRVTVRDLKPGSIIQVWARGLSGVEQPISRQLLVYEKTMDVELTQGLVEGHEVWAVQWACASVRRDSAREEVLPAPSVDDPAFIDPVTRIDQNITVEGTLRDATVEVRRKVGETWIMIGKTRANGTTTVVPLTTPLAVDDVLSVRQRYCSIQTPGRATTTVVKPVPLRPILQAPTPGKQVPVDTSVVLTWKDPATGSDADRKADTFDVTVLRNGTKVFEITTPTTTATIPQAVTVAYSALFTWSVVPRNTTGNGAPADSNFRTPPAPKPEITAIQDKDKVKVTGKKFAKSREVLIDMKVEYFVFGGSPQQPVAFNDNRQVTLTTTSTATGTFEYTFSPKDELPPINVLTGPPQGQNAQLMKAAPSNGAQVTITARNKPPIPADEGSSDTSNAVGFQWQG